MVLELKEASPDQIDSLWATNFSSWGAPLDLQGYIIRERRLLQTPLLKDGGLTFWILVDSPCVTPLCACETFNRKRGLVKAPGKGLEEVPVIGVASVFTPPQNRGKGYAGSMMQLLSKRLQETTGGKGCSVLYSDVGPKFYQQNGGWKSVDGIEIILPSTTTFVDTFPVENLSIEGAENCIHEDVQCLKNEFVGNAEKTTLQLIPQHSELEWATVRDQEATKHLNLQVPDSVGAKFSSPDGWGYILWFREYKESSLTVLRLREPSNDGGLRGLFQAAVDEAKRSGLSKVTIWAPSPRTEKVTGVERVTRKMAIPALLYLGDEEENVAWQSIEKLGWC